MDINSISNNINHAEQPTNVSLRKTDELSPLSKDDSLSLSISNIYNKTRDELSDSLQVLNEGIAINQISKNAMEKQKSYLDNIENILVSAVENKNDDIDSDDVKSNIKQNLYYFNEISDRTQYKNEKLLTINNEESNFITISTKDSLFNIEKPETKSISYELDEAIDTMDLSKVSNLTKAISDTSIANNKINNFILKVVDIEQQIIQNAKNTISEQINLSKENSSLGNIDFGMEMSDFSKTNINSHLGFLAGTQANIAQEQSIRLLTK